MWSLYLDLPSIGEKFYEGDVFGSVKYINAVSIVHCPVAGKVIEVNAELQSAPNLVKHCPLGTGWLVKLKLDSHFVRIADMMISLFSMERRTIRHYRRPSA